MQICHNDQPVVVIRIYTSIGSDLRGGGYNFSKSTGQILMKLSHYDQSEDGIRIYT